MTRVNWKPSVCPSCGMNFDLSLRESILSFLRDRDEAAIPYVSCGRVQFRTGASTNEIWKEICRVFHPNPPYDALKSILNGMLQRNEIVRHEIDHGTYYYIP